MSLRPPSQLMLWVRSYCSQNFLASSALAGAAMPGKHGKSDESGYEGLHDHSPACFKRVDYLGWAEPAWLVTLK